MQLLDPNPFVNRVNVYGEDDSEPPILEIPSDVSDLTSDDIWNVFSDFSGDVAEFSLIVEEFNGVLSPMICLAS